MVAGKAAGTASGKSFISNSVRVFTTVDDSIFEKAYTDENGLVTFHYDHS